ncbi:MAG TPA: hypothetical protein PKD64_16115 [Pirellulaceae bacterium]|nr:hypothetical protein [Pirellulaceae bacterium]HMO93714.1 hypothetical protein [Pirellulaceae bacterium]HMP69783.1 hypothetical protein [Pirellulaceae bacterium]
MNYKVLIRNVSAFVLLATAVGTCNLSFAQVSRLDELERGIRSELRAALPIIRTTTTGQQSVQISTTVRDGVRITQVVSSPDGKFTIKVDEDGAIEMEMAREYGLDDAEKLSDSHPEISMYMKAIPREVGDSKINVKFEITTTVKADNEDQLKEVDEDAYRLYKQYGQGAISTMPAMRLMGAADAFEAMELAVEGFGGEGIRVIPRGIAGDTAELRLEVGKLEATGGAGGGAEGRIEGGGSVTIRGNAQGDAVASERSSSKAEERAQDQESRQERNNR